jgi:hypothetical protein
MFSTPLLSGWPHSMASASASVRNSTEVLVISATLGLKGGVMPEDKAADYLAQEYLELQKIIEGFDARALTIKAWSVTFSAAGLGFAYQQHNPVLLLVAAGSALVFWMVEAISKLDQRAFIPRISQIEALFVDSYGQRSAPFQINEQCERAHFTGLSASEGRAARALVPFLAGIMLPHVVIVAAGVLLYFLAPPV